MGEDDSAEDRPEQSVRRLPEWCLQKAVRQIDGAPSRCRGKRYRTDCIGRSGQRSTSQMAGAVSRGDRLDRVRHVQGVPKETPNAEP